MPEIPADVRACFGTVVGAPAAGQALTQDMVFSLVAALKRSEKKKDLCGQRLIKWYDHLRLGVDTARA
ncbi:hypothetical protein [Rhizobium arsenicireducens]